MGKEISSRGLLMACAWILSEHLHYTTTQHPGARARDSRSRTWHPACWGALLDASTRIQLGPRSCAPALDPYKAALPEIWPST